MTRKVFSEEEQQLLRRNPYTFKVTHRQVWFTKEFKTEFKKRYDLGALPREIFADLGYDPKVVGDYRMNSFQNRINIRAKRGEGFTERRTSVSRGLVSVDENPDSAAIVRMQHELLYLRQEVEFLKKISSIRDSRR